MKIFFFLLAIVFSTLSPLKAEASAPTVMGEITTHDATWRVENHDMDETTAFSFTAPATKEHLYIGPPAPNFLSDLKKA